MRTTVNPPGLYPYQMQRIETQPTDRFLFIDRWNGSSHALWLVLSPAKQNSTTHRTWQTAFLFWLFLLSHRKAFLPPTSLSKCPLYCLLCFCAYDRIVIVRSCDVAADENEISWYLAISHLIRHNEAHQETSVWIYITRSQTHYRTRKLLDSHSRGIQFGSRTRYRLYWQMFCGFPQTFKGSTGIIPLVGHDQILPNPYQFSNHRSSYCTTTPQISRSRTNR
jgi:hypothetical protein